MMGAMNKKSSRKMSIEPYKEPTYLSNGNASMDPDARAASILERLDKLRKKVKGIRQDLEEIEQDLKAADQGREIPKP
jgi:hypothetical protein